MILRVNKFLQPDRRIRFSAWSAELARLGELYRGFFPRSSVYSFYSSGAILLAVVAVAMAALSLWEYAAGK